MASSGDTEKDVAVSLSAQEHAKDTLSGIAGVPEDKTIGQYLSVKHCLSTNVSTEMISIILMIFLSLFVYMSNSTWFKVLIEQAEILFF